jgi:hypothetical protein
MVPEPQFCVFLASYHGGAFVFQEGYSKYFLCCPQYSKLFRQVSKIDEGEDQKIPIGLFQKYPLGDVCVLREGAIEKDNRQSRTGRMTDVKRIRISN